jgi:hypothetical protein
VILLNSLELIKRLEQHVHQEGQWLPSLPALDALATLVAREIRSGQRRRNETKG